MLVIVYENYFSTFDFSWSWLIYAFCIGNKKKKTAICLPEYFTNYVGWDEHVQTLLSIYSEMLKTN